MGYLDMLSAGGSSGSGGYVAGKWDVIASPTIPTIVPDSTIVVITAIEMTGYTISQAEPPNPAQGLVWIKIMSQSVILSHGAAAARLQCAVIYDDEAWVPVESYYACFDGVVPIYGLLFEGGQEVTPWALGNATSTGTFVNTGAALQLYLVANAALFGGVSGVTVRPVNTTGFTTLWMRTPTCTGYSRYFGLYTIRAIRPSYAATSGGVKEKALGVGDNFLDISGAQGDFYVGISSGNSSTEAANIHATKIWME